jgi:hypothetical protein
MIDRSQENHQTKKDKKLDSLHQRQRGFQAFLQTLFSYGYAALGLL